MRDSYFLPIYIAGTMLIVMFSLTITVLLVIQKHRRAAASLREQEMQHAHEQSLLQTRIDVHETSLRLISQEIHDNIGQMLSLSCLEMAEAQRYTTDAKANDLLNSSTGIIRKVAKSLRMLSHSLNNTLVMQGDFHRIIADELARIEHLNVISCELITAGEPVEIDMEKRLLIFRIVQEALQNILKHAGATRITISLCYEASKLLVEVSDNGAGFDDEQMSKRGSLGMINMQERAQMLNAKLMLDSALGKGTVVRLQIQL